MHRHDADFVALLLHVALDLRAGRPQPVQKPLQAWGLARLIVEREAEEFIDRVSSFGAEARQQGAAQSVRFEPRHVELERLFARRRCPPLAQLPNRAGTSEIAVRLGGKRVPQAPAPAMTDMEEIVIVKIEGGTFQQRRQSQIVLGQQQAVAQRQKVHHRKLIGELHAVRARDG